MNECINHPGVPATHRCYHCNSAICWDCMEIVKGRHVCQACERAQQDAAPTKPAVPYYGQRRKRRFLNPTSLGEGLVYAAAVGALGAVIWEKLDFVLKVQFSPSSSIMRAPRA